MAPRHLYVGILVTGCLHLVLGVADCITAIIGLATGPYVRAISAVALLVGVWILLVGSLGIATGVQVIEDEKIRKLILLVRGSDVTPEWQHLNDEKIRQLKIAYMVTAILTACLFCSVASGLSVGYIIAGANRRSAYREDYVELGAVGLVIAFLECIVAIISSSICCCCSPRTPNGTGIIQGRAGTTIAGQSTIQYQPMDTMESQQPANTSMQYQTSDYEGASSNPPAYQQRVDPTKPV